MTTGCWIIQLYNVPTTNRLNLLGYSFPQKTIRVQGASNYAAVLSSEFSITIGGELRQEKWEIFQLFFLASPVAGKHNCQNVEI